MVQLVGSATSGGSHDKLRATTTPFVKRTIRPLYHPANIYPMAEMLDRKAVEDKIIFPGMVATKLDSGLVTIASLGDKPSGLFANFVNGNLSDISEGHSEIGIWKMGTFEILWQKDYSPLAIDAWYGSQVGKGFFWNDLGEIVQRPQYTRQPSLGVLDDLVVIPGGSFRIQVDLRL